MYRYIIVYTMHTVYTVYATYSIQYASRNILHLTDILLQKYIHR